MVGVDDIRQQTPEFLQINPVEQALKDGKLEACTERADSLLDAPQPSGVADIVADEVTLTLHQISVW
jgi:hypothetical protein